MLVVAGVSHGVRTGMSVGGEMLFGEGHLFWGIGKGGDGEGAEEKGDGRRDFDVRVG